MTRYGSRPAAPSSIGINRSRDGARRAARPDPPCLVFARQARYFSYSLSEAFIRMKPMRDNVGEAVTALVRPGAVHRRLYDDPAIFELELERIFGSAWIYVGHESQVKEPGDYFCTFLGRKP